MFDIAVRVAVFPVLAMQGLMTRRKARFLPEPAGAREGVSGAGPDIGLLILGDSSAAGVGVAHQNEALLGHIRDRLSDTHRVTWVVDAVTGATTADTVKRLQARPAAKFEVVSVSLGVNDITNLVRLPVWLRRQSEVLDILQDKFGAEVICVSGIPKMGQFPLLPNPLRWVLGRQAARFDTELRALVAQRPEVRFVEMEFEADERFMSADGFHPGPVIYAEWGQKVFEAIREDAQV